MHQPGSAVYITLGLYQMLEMNFAFTRPWTVRLPTLVRQISTEYVDAFFNDGSLRLSSFEAFRRHPDEKRRDGQEGLVAMEVNTPTGSLSILGACGQEAYIMCASTVETPIGENDGSASAFRIFDSLKFADAVSRQIPGFIGGTEGFCIYRKNTMITKSDPNPIIVPTAGVNSDSWFQEQKLRTAKLAIDAYFMKHISFAHEAEYRFIWFAENSRKQFLDIRCPAAIECCERVTKDLSEPASQPSFPSGSQTFFFGDI